MKLRTVWITWFAAAMLIAGVSTPTFSAQAQDESAAATIVALQTQVAELSAPTSTPSPTSTAKGDTPEATVPQQKTVNLEIILDVSGSMGQVIDTSETRMEAAKRVLNEVIAAIPTAPSINVGLRIYGHGGDNSEAGRSVSCQSSDLVVPIEGVDREAIAGQIAPLVPTGWTPIELSLERSAADFPISEAKATNAVVLVTDGLETCGGNPAAASSALVSSDKSIVTHVIGFALTPEEQQILQSITDASGGMLLGASNATELTGALFKILDELDVVKGAGFIGGNALSLLPVGEANQLSVVAVGAYQGTTLPFVVRNNTGTPVVSLSATARAINPAGQLIATGGDQILNPNLLRPGGLSLGYIYFGGVALAPDTTFQIDVQGTPTDKEQFENQRDLEVVEAAYVDGRIVGTLRNSYDEQLFGPFGVQVACFDPNGTLIDIEKVFTPEQAANPDETVTFQAPVIGTFECPLFLVAGSGFSRSFNKKASAILTPVAAQARGQQIETPGPAGSTTPAASSPMPTTNPTEPPNPAQDNAAAVSMATPEPNGCYDLGTAVSVVRGLAAQDIPIGEFIEYTAETDPNELLGRPGGYTSKVNFLDTRLDPKSPDFDTTDGGSVEVFASEQDLQNRVAHLKAVWESIPLFSEEVVFTEDTVLLRVSPRLLIPDSDAYGTALHQMAACG